MQSDDPQTPPERLASRFSQAWNRPVSKSFIVGLIAGSVIALFILSMLGRRHSGARQGCLPSAHDEDGPLRGLSSGKHTGIAGATGGLRSMPSPINPSQAARCRISDSGAPVRYIVPHADE